MNLRTVERQPVRVGVVGCGVVADYGHIPTLHRLPEAQLVGFADPNEERRKAQARKYNLPCFGSFEEMASAVEMDAVTIATQPDVKLDMIRIAARHGLHAFCEKPLTETIEDAEELVRLMGEAVLFVGVAFVYRGKKIVRRMMELVREGAIGQLRVVRIENLWDYHGLRDEAVRGDRRRRALRNLGTLDCGVHDLDLIRYISGAEYEELHAVGAIIEKENVFPDHIIANGRMSNGVLFHLEESAVWGYTAKDRPKYLQGYHLVGDNGVLSSGALKLEDETAELYVVSGWKQWTETHSRGKAWDDTYRQFLQVIRGEDVPDLFLADGHDALVNMRVGRQLIEQC